MQDRALQARFQEANKANDREGAAQMAVELGKDKGYSLTMEEVRAYIQRTITTSAPGEELSDEQLESVAGGAQAQASFLDNWGCVAE